MKQFRMTSLLLAMLMLLSVSYVSATETAAPTLLADWGDMSQALGKSDAGPVKAQTGDFYIWGYPSAYPIKTEAVGYKPNYGLSYQDSSKNSYGRLSPSASDRTSTYVADIFSALSGAFTFETWIKMASSSRAGIFEMRNDAGTDGNTSTYGGLYSFETTVDGVKAQNLVFRRKFSDKFVEFTSSQRFTANEWHHIVCSYDSSNSNNVPLVLVDGVQYTMLVPENFEMPESSAVTFTTNKVSDAEKNSVMFGQNKYNTAANEFAKDLYYSELRFYSGTATQDWAEEQYNKTAGQFMADYTDISFFDRFGTPADSNKNALGTTGNKIILDLSEADKLAVNENNVYINDVSTGNKLLPVTRTWDGNNYILSDFTLKDGNKYELCILKTVENASGESCWKYDQIIPFTCDTENVIELIANWKNENPTEVTHNSATYLRFEDTVGSGLYLMEKKQSGDGSVKVTTAMEGYDGKARTNTSHEGFQVNKPEGNTYVDGSKAIVDAFTNKNITFETWLKIPSGVTYTASGAAPVFTLYDNTDGNKKLVFELTAQNLNSNNPGLVFQGYDVNNTILSWATEILLSKDNWYHIVLTNAADGYKVFVNGEQKKQNTSPLYLNGATNIKCGFGYGYKYDTSRDFRYGLFDDISVWNGVLTNEQVLAIYNNERADYETDFDILLKDNSDADVSYDAYAAKKETAVKSFNLSTSYDYTGKITAKNKVTGAVTALTAASGSVSLADLKAGAYTIAISKDTITPARGADYTVDVVVCNNAVAVTELTIDAPNGLTAAAPSAKLVNTAEGAKDVTVYLASYADADCKMLKGITTATGNVTNNGTAVSITTSEGLDISNRYYKLFVFDSGVQPLTEAVISAAIN